MKKVLIITYYWPPAGGPGVQRWLKFVKYLPEFNIEPVVYVPDNPNYPIIDDSLEAEIPEGITILKHPIKEPYKLGGILSQKSTRSISKGIIHHPKKQGLIEKLMLYIRGNYFIPDARKAWVKPSVKYLSGYIQDNDIQTVITTGPPHSLHLIGLKLKESMNLKWIADFRDPWTTIGYHKKLKLSTASKVKHKDLERQVLNSADHVIVTSQITKTEFESKTKSPISVITNGYDAEFPSGVQLDDKFSLAHIGSLLSERNPDSLWKALNELVSENEVFAKSFQLDLIGTVSEDVLESIDNYNLTQHTNVIGYVPHKEAQDYQRRSQVLLMIEIDSEDTKCIIPGKLFEYMASNRPILAIGPEGSDVATMVKETNTGKYFGYQDYASLKEWLIKQFELYQHDKLKIEPRGIDKYHRRALTESLAELI
ncbi:MAG: glycosyltransferase family 4 protein [Flavobacteriaceae bacterium]|nr:glycosyltransferase family 4 protein [Bacteroidia bacterium]NNL61307.1 glycosyltransferase family 4 protein [Flavobacteriaceae bacterium]